MVVRDFVPNKRFARALEIVCTTRTIPLNPSTNLDITLQIVARSCSSFIQQLQVLLEHRWTSKLPGAKGIESTAPNGWVYILLPNLVNYRLEMMWKSIDTSSTSGTERPSRGPKYPGLMICWFWTCLKTTNWQTRRFWSDVIKVFSEYYVDRRWALGKIHQQRATHLVDSR